MRGMEPGAGSVGIRIAAIGDVHVRTEFPAELAASLTGLSGRADALVIAGDITDGGRLLEAEIAAEVLRQVNLPIVAVLGNHDRRCLRRTAFRRILEGAGVRLLDGEATALDLAGLHASIGFAGVGGYGGGFWPDEGPPGPTFRLSQAVAVRARREAMRLESAIAALHTDLKVVLMHYSPTATTLGDEPPVKYWMLGNSELAKVIDRHEVDLVIHGHAHLGNTHGHTLGGTPVRNVAAPVTGGPTMIDLAWPRPARLMPAWPVIERKA